MSRDEEQQQNVTSHLTNPPGGPAVEGGATSQVGTATDADGQHRHDGDVVTRLVAQFRERNYGSGWSSQPYSTYSNFLQSAARNGIGSRIRGTEGLRNQNSTSSSSSQDAHSGGSSDHTEQGHTRGNLPDRPEQQSMYQAVNPVNNGLHPEAIGAYDDVNGQLIVREHQPVDPGSSQNITDCRENCVDLVVPEPACPGSEGNAVILYADLPNKPGSCDTDETMCNGLLSEAGEGYDVVDGRFDQADCWSFDSDTTLVKSRGHEETGLIYHRESHSGQSCDNKGPDDVDSDNPSFDSDATLVKSRGHEEPELIYHRQSDIYLMGDAAPGQETVDRQLCPDDAELCVEGHEPLSFPVSETSTDSPLSRASAEPGDLDGSSEASDSGGYPEAGESLHVGAENSSPGIAMIGVEQAQDSPASNDSSFEFQGSMLNSIYDGISDATPSEPLIVNINDMARFEGVLQNLSSEHYATDSNASAQHDPSDSFTFDRMPGDTQLQAMRDDRELNALMKFFSQESARAEVNYQIKKGDFNVEKLSVVEEEVFGYLGNPALDYAVIGDEVYSIQPVAGGPLRVLAQTSQETVRTIGIKGTAAAAIEELQPVHVSEQCKPEDLITQLRQAVQCGRLDCERLECCYWLMEIAQIIKEIKNRTDISLSSHNQYVLECVMSHEADCTEIWCEVPWCSLASYFIGVFESMDTSSEREPTVHEFVTFLRLCVNDINFGLPHVQEGTDCNSLVDGSQFEYTNQWSTVSVMGSFGQVVLAQSILPCRDTYLAIKRMKDDGSRSTLFHMMCKGVSHEDLVPICHPLWYIQEDAYIYLASRFEGAYGSLEAFMATQTMPLRFELLCEFSEQIVAAAQFFHQQGLLFLAWRASNAVVCERNGRQMIKLCNFSHLASPENIDEDDVEDIMNALPPRIVPPEMHSGRLVLELSDVWGIGLLVYELATGHVMFHDLRHEDPEWIREELAECPEVESRDLDEVREVPLRNFIAICMQVDPNQRPRLAVVMNNRPQMPE